MSPRALIASCHPAPCVAVTLFAAVLAQVAGNSTRIWVLVGAAVLAGQLSIGWSNDRIDAGRDSALGRTDKPAATGQVSQRALDVAITLALIATVVLSFALGWRAALVHLAAVECGWLYNVWLKGTVWSWLPYALAFGALPIVATLALDAHRPPGAWVVAAGACLGVAAHFANTLPDLAGDLLTGVRGLPQRLGARPVVLLSAALLLVTTGLIVFAAPSHPHPIGWVGAVVVVVAVLVGVPLLLREAGLRDAGRGAFVAIMVLAAVNVMMLASSDTHLR